MDCTPQDDLPTSLDGTLVGDDGTPVLDCTPQDSLPTSQDGTLEHDSTQTLEHDSIHGWDDWNPQVDGLPNGVPDDDSNGGDSGGDDTDGGNLPPAIERLEPIDLDYPYPHDRAQRADVRIVLPWCLEDAGSIRVLVGQMERSAVTVGELDDAVKRSSTNAASQVSGDLTGHIEEASVRLLQGPMTEVQRCAQVAAGSLRLYVRTIDDFNETADRLNREMHEAAQRHSNSLLLLKVEYTRLINQARLAIEYYTDKVELIVQSLAQGPTLPTLVRFNHVADNVGLEQITPEGLGSGGPVVSTTVPSDKDRNRIENYIDRHAPMQVDPPKFPGPVPGPGGIQIQPYDQHAPSTVADPQAYPANPTNNVATTYTATQPQQAAAPHDHERTSQPVDET